MKKHLNKSMVEFVKDCRKNNQLDNIRRFWHCEKYANALSQNPRLGHFIPCDENDVPLVEPNEKYSSNVIFYEAFSEYQQACDRVLFDGFKCKEAEFCDELMYEVFKDNLYIVYDPDQKTFEIENEEVFMNSYEDLVKYNLPLTKAGAKFFGL